MTTYGYAQVNAVPADDEWFNLEVDNDVDPMSVVTTAGYSLEGWKYLGPKLLGKRTLRVKLIRFGYVRNLERARKKVHEMGYRLVEGQARNSFMAKFPKPDGLGSVVFGGSEWLDPSGYALVAYLDGFGVEWGSDFRWSGHGFGGACRWLVVDK